MGCASSISIDATEKIKVSKDLFVLNGLIGEGGFGKVFTALFVKNQQWYALKEINKVKMNLLLILYIIITKIIIFLQSKLMKHRTGATMLQGELDAMKRIQHTFVVSLHFAFQDR